MITFEDVLGRLTAEQRELLTQIRDRKSENTLYDAVVHRILTWELEEAHPDTQPHLRALFDRYRLDPTGVEAAVRADIVDNDVCDEPVLAEIEHLLYLEAYVMAGALRHSFGRAYLDSREVIDGEDFEEREGTHRSLEREASALTSLWRAISVIAEEVGWSIDECPSQMSFGDVAYNEYMGRVVDSEMFGDPEEWAKNVLAVA